MKESIDGSAPGTKPAPPRRSSHNIFWLVAERGLKAVGGLGLAVLLARHLGPEHYGNYGAAIGLATLAKEAVMLGFDRMVRRDLAASPHRAGEILGTSVLLALAVSVIVISALGSIAGHLIADEETRRLTWIVMWMALPQAFYSCEVWFESSGDTRPLVRTRNAVWGVSFAGRLALIFLGAGVYAFAALALLEWVCTYAAVGALLKRQTEGRMGFAFSRTQLAGWMREGWPAIVMVLVGATADRVMVLVAQMLGDEAEAGYLSAALRITEVWWSISTIIGSVLLPRIVSLQLREPKRCEQIVQLYADSGLLVGTCAALAATAVAPVVVPFAFGEAYAKSALVLVVLFWAGPAIFPAVGRTQFWVSRRLLALDLPMVVTVAAAQIALSILLIPRYGALGAAIAITGAQWIGVYGLTLLLPAHRRESGPQLRAFRALIRPWSTFRSLYQFVKGMLH